MFSTLPFKPIREREKKKNPAQVQEPFPDFFTSSSLPVLAIFLIFTYVLINYILIVADNSRNQS